MRAEKTKPSTASGCPLHSASVEAQGQVAVPIVDFATKQAGEMSDDDSECEMVSIPMAERRLKPELPEMTDDDMAVCTTSRHLAGQRLNLYR